MADNESSLEFAIHRQIRSVNLTEPVGGGPAPRVGELDRQDCMNRDLDFRFVSDGRPEWE
jgi:hypothetical protein